MTEHFDAEQYMINGLLKACKPKPKAHKPQFVGIDGREFGHRHNNTMSVGKQLLAAISKKDDVDAYVQLKEMARRPKMRSKRNR